MTKKDKITIKKNWAVAGINRIGIINCTYRQALSYLEDLRRRKIYDVLLKPLAVK